MLTKLKYEKYIFRLVRKRNFPDREDQGPGLDGRGLREHGGRRDAIVIRAETVTGSKDLGLTVEELNI